MSAAAVRGSAVERGVHLGLINPDLPVEQCIAAAEAAFDREMVLNPDDRRETERSNIAGYAQNALSELRPYGIPSAAQNAEQMLRHVEHLFGGYLDGCQEGKIELAWCVVTARTASSSTPSSSAPTSSMG